MLVIPAALGEDHEQIPTLQRVESPLWSRFSGLQLVERTDVGAGEKCEEEGAAERSCAI